MSDSPTSAQPALHQSTNAARVAGLRGVWLLVAGLLVAALAAANAMTPLPAVFVGSDSFPILVTSQYENLGELFTVMTTRLMPDYYPGAYYRPVAGLIWGAEYAAWGLDARPYLWVNVCLHVINALLLIPLAKALFGQRSMVGWWAALLFASLPFSVDNVAVLARLPDLLSGVLITSVLVVHFRARAKESAPVLACVLCLIALGVKESAYILAPLIVAGHLIAGEGLTKTLKKSWPYIILLLLFLALRISVLGGMGGSIGAQAQHGSLGQIPLDFLSTLALPFGVRESWSAATGTSIAIRIVGALLLAGGYAVVSQRSTSRPKAEITSAPRGGLGILACWVLLLILAALPAGHFERRYAYLASIPAMLLIASLLVHAVNFPKLKPLANVAALLVAWNFTFAPVFGGYDEWRDGGVIVNRYLEEVDQIVADSDPTTSTLTFPDCPRLLIYADRVPNIPQAYLLGKRSLRAYLALRYPNRDITINARTKTVTEPPP